MALVIDGEKMNMKEPNIKPIGRREIEEIITSDKFLRRFSEAANITWKTNHETGFHVVRDIYENRIIYGNVVGFDAESEVIYDPTDSIRGGFSRSVEPLLDKYGLSLENNDIYPVVNLHFHPFPSTFDPSEADIKNFLGKREDLFCEESYSARINCKPVFVVGSQPTSERTIDLLLLQETGNRPLRRVFADILVSSIENESQYRDDNATIARLYDKQSGIKAAMLTFERNNGIYKLKRGDYQKISRFASTPEFLGFAEPDITTIYKLLSR